MLGQVHPTTTPHSPEFGTTLRLPALFHQSSKIRLLPLKWLHGNEMKAGDTGRGLELIQCNKPEQILYLFKDLSNTLSFSQQQITPALTQSSKHSYNK